LKKARKVVELGEGAIFSKKYFLFLFLGITFWLQSTREEFTLR
jgi:hypothetical protein